MGHSAERRDIDRDGARAAIGVTAEQRAAIMPGIRTQPARKRLEPTGRQARRQPDGEQETERRRALGGEIGQVDPQRLARHRIGGVFGKEMHARDDPIGREHEIAPGGRRNGRSIVGEIERPRMGDDRPEIGGDEAVLGRGFGRI